MNKKRILLIVNPCAGKRKAQRQLADIISVFNQAGYMVITYITVCAGDGERAVLEYAEQADLIVCCGGDGTLNETISGVLKSGTDKPIGYIPAGSTNDFATTLHLSGDMVQAAKDIIEGEEMQLDVGQFGNRYFAYIASFGIFTKTSYETPQEWKNALGHTAYILGGIQELSQLKTHHLRFELSTGEVVEDRFLFGAISNSTSVGGIISLAQDRVDLCDGKLELLLIHAPKDLMELTDCVKAIQRKTYDSKLITFMNASEIYVTAPAELGWTVDGEKESGHSAVSVKCLQKAIRIRVKK